MGAIGKAEENLSEKATFLLQTFKGQRPWHNLTVVRECQKTKKKKKKRNDSRKADSI